MATGFRFDGKNEAAQRAAAREGARLIVQVSSETKRAIRSVIARVIREGIPPRDAAKIIEKLVGLTQRQAMAALNYRATLHRHKASVADELLERYVRKKIEERAEAIARTEIMGALNAGAQQSFRQAVEQGLLGRNAKKEWIATLDRRVCPICEALDGKQVPLKGTFRTGGGTLSGPPAHPQCRCTIVAVP